MTIVDRGIRITVLQIQRINLHAIRSLFIFVPSFRCCLLLLKYAYVLLLTTSADVKRKRSRTHIVEQSKFVSNHLFGLVLNESAYSIPCVNVATIIDLNVHDHQYRPSLVHYTFNNGFNSGQMNALPA